MTDVPSWATPVTNQRAETEERAIPSWATPVNSGRTAPSQVPSWATPVRSQAPARAFRDIKVGTYTQDDLSTDSRLYDPILRYMSDRVGLQAVENASREKVVDMFLNERRGNAAGNSVRIGSNVDYMLDIKDSPERLRIAGEAYSIFEGMAGIFSDHATWSETGEGLVDYVRATLFDPINLVGGALGKAAGGTALRAGAQAVEKAMQKEVASQLAKGATRKAAETAGNQVLRNSVKQASKENTQEIAQFAATLSAKKGFQRVMTKAGLTEVSVTAFSDAVINAGAETLYQRSLVQTGVQEEINKNAVGLAALGALALGGVQAVRVARRGSSETALLTETLKKSSPAEVAKELSQSVESYLKGNEFIRTPWAEKVAKGEEITDADSDFWIDLLLGVSDEEGNVLMKGLAQTLQEGGHYYTKASEDDKISNWLADFLREMGPDSVKEIVKGVESGLGREVKGLADMTPDDFASAFAKKINSSARNMNSVMQVSKRMNKSIGDMPLDEFMEEALELTGIKIPGLDDPKWKTSGRLSANISETQNKFIRALVSHPSTSALNVVGYVSAAGIDMSTDLLMALYKGGRGTLNSVIKGKEAGADDLFVAEQLLKANADRIRFAIDPDMTYAAYKSAMENQTGALQQLNRTLSGGIDVSTSSKSASALGGIGGKAQNAADTYISAMQTATFVHAQDALTKSQEYVTQMNKALRIHFKKGWTEFYSSPDALEKMASKEYKQIETNVVTKVLENTFAKSYKGPEGLGRIAGVIEDARSMPGIGFMVPFGRFFNNTIDFGVKNTPVLNVVAKASGKYADKEYSELVARGAVAAGLVYSFAQNEDEKRRQGLGLYDSIVDGEVINQQYDYPLSLFIAAGRLASYNIAGEEVPEDILEQVGKDFFGGSLTRNLTDTGGLIAEIGAAILSSELETAGATFGQLTSEISAQAISGFTRHLEPLDTALGLVTERDQRPRDVAQGNKFVGDSLRYINNTVDLLSGDMLPLKVSSYAGVLDQQTTKNLGVRVTRLTNTQRLMNMIGESQWMINSGLSKDKRLAIPEAVNEYQRLVYQSAEEWATKKMSNPIFRSLTSEQQRVQWEEELSRIKKAAKFGLLASYSGPQSTLAAQYDIMSGNSLEDVEEAIQDLGLDKTIGELSPWELSNLETRLKSKELRLKMSIPLSAN